MQRCQGGDRKAGGGSRSRGNDGKLNAGEERCISNAWRKDTSSSIADRAIEFEVE